MHIGLTAFALLLGCSQSQVEVVKVCGDGLVPIPAADPVFCMMRYEAKITESTGKVYGFRDGESSLEKVVPSVNVSLINAQKACSSTPVLDSRGEIRGYMRLATLDHWRDAGDGVLGEGGSLYPWGDDPQGGRCVLDRLGSGNPWSGVQPSATEPSCKSVFGIYDQIGNLWEWVDLEVTADQNAWQEALRRDGWELEIKDRGIFMTKGELLHLSLNSICVNVDSLYLGKDASLMVQGSLSNVNCPDSGKGYLIYKKEGDVGELLPIEVDFAKGQQSAQIMVATERLGEKIGAKVGGSFYSGGDSTFESIWVGHIPTFDGSIGFRCEADPFEVVRP